MKFTNRITKVLLDRILGIVLFCLFLTMVCPVVALAQNSPPVADAGPDLFLEPGQAGLLQGSAVDPDGDPIVSWLWSLDSSPAGSNPYLSDPRRPNPDFVGDIEGVYVLSLVVSDGTDSSLPDSVTVTATANQPPVAVLTADVTSGVVPLTVNCDSVGSYDPEGSALTYIWRFSDVSGVETTPTVSHTFTFAGTFMVDLSVIDDRGQVGSDFILVTVTPAVTTISIDIKPKYCPNPLNVRRKGVLPVAILGTVDLDVRDIDIATLEINGVAPDRSAFKDVATPNGFEPCACLAVGGDGSEDLILKFSNKKIIAILDVVSNGDEIPLTLTGMLQDGTTHIEGIDCIVIEGVK